MGSFFQNAAFINHNDSEGGYLSFSQLGIKGTENPIEWNDLDKLREELKEIGKLDMPEEVREVYVDFERIVNMTEDSESKTVMVIFC